MLPAGADAVLQIELIAEADGAVVLGDDVAPGRNVRHPGEDLRAGTTVLHRGTVLGPAELGVAITAGRDALRCAQRARVEILGTGDELVDPGAPLGPGQIHDSNGPMLRALAEQAGARAATRRVGRRSRRDRAGHRAGARRAPTSSSSAAACRSARTTTSSPRSAANGVEEVFWRVALRPGKPTWFGVRRSDDDARARPARATRSPPTSRSSSSPAPRSRRCRAPTRSRGCARRGWPSTSTAIPTATNAVRVSIGEDGAATPTGPQGSHILSSLLGADGLAVIPRGPACLRRAPRW